MGTNQESVAELLVPPVFYYVTDRAASDPNRRSLVMVSSTVALTNGTGTIPTNALVKHMNVAAIAVASDATLSKKMRWVKTWDEFIRPLDGTLGYFTAVGTNSIYMTVPGTAYAPGSGLTGNITLTIPQIPTIPTAAGTAITAPGEIEQDLINTLARALRDPMNWMKEAA